MISQRNACYIDLSRNRACETSIQLCWFRWLGRHGIRQRQALSGSLRLPRCSPRDRLGFKPTAAFGWRLWPSTLRGVVCDATCRACHLLVLPLKEKGDDSRVLAAVTVSTWNIRCNCAHELLECASLCQNGQRFPQSQLRLLMRRPVSKSHQLQFRQRLHFCSVQVVFLVVLWPLGCPV